MKSTTLALFLLSATLALSQARFISPKNLLVRFDEHYGEPTFEDAMDEFKFFMKSMYAGYNGFIRGFYHEHARTIVPETCMGEWVTQNLTYLEAVYEKMYNFEILDIPYDDAIEAAKDVVNLIYRNRDFCGVDKLVLDIKGICDYDGCFDDIDVAANFKANMFAIMAKIEPVIEYLMSPEMLEPEETDEEILQMCDTFGEAYGSLISFLIGFDKRYN